MCLVSLDDPGLTVFGYHRLLGGLTGPEQAGGAWRAALREHFELEEVEAAELGPGRRRGRRRLRLHRLALPPALPPAPEGHDRSSTSCSPTARTPTGARRRDPRGADPEARRWACPPRTSRPSAGSATPRAPGRRSSTIDDDGDYQAAFLLRPTPVEQVREVAAAGETMPPKSTFFFPKVPTGIVFNPLGGVTRIYTKKGDDGTTSLWYGGRVQKSDAAHRGLRLGRRGGLGARRRPRAVSSPREAGSRPTSCGSRTTCSSPAPSWRPRRRRPTGSRTASRGSPAEMVDELDGVIDHYMDRVDLPPKFVIPGGRPALGRPRRRPGRDPPRRAARRRARAKPRRSRAR